jgi:hypothetical protein
MKTIKVKLNVRLGGYEEGAIVTLQTDGAGVPIEKFWRRRLRDAETDNCMEAVKSSKPKKEADK